MDYRKMTDSFAIQTVSPFRVCSKRTGRILFYALGLDNATTCPYGSAKKKGRFKRPFFLPQS